MASKQLGRLRQWAGEVISSREKTTIHEEFRDLEKDIELRRDGMQRLLVASEAYHYNLSNKKTNDSLPDTDKLLPIDTLGLVMITHGEEFGGDSSFGRALVNLGRAHCKVATLQEAYALTLKDTFVTSMDRFKEDIKEYEILRKKLDSTRSAYDAAVTKYEKVVNGKKEKDKLEAEDELDRTKQRYDEVAEDLRAHMHAIQENEHSQLQELTSFLALETNFVRSYLDVLLDVKESWQGGTKIQRNDHDSQLLQPSRTNSLRSNGRDPTPSSLSSELSDSEPGTISKYLRRGSVGSKSSSRPASRLSRKTNNSAVSVPNGEDEKHGHETKSRRMSITGWASSAVDSVTGSKGKKSKDTEAFAALDDDAGAGNAAEHQINGISGSLKKSALGRRPSSNSHSRENMPPKVAPRILKPPSMQEKKVVRALYDFSGSTDELSFKSGNEIIVLNEVLDDWWMGELNGQKGLFPMSYTEVIDSSSYPIPHKPGVLECMNGYGKEDDYLTSDVDEDRELTAAPMAIGSPLYGNFDDAISLTGSLADDEDDLRSQSKFFPFLQEQPFSDPLDYLCVVSPTPPPQRQKRNVLLSGDPAQESLIGGATDKENPPSTTTPTRKQPPPPPPRRPVNQIPSSGPPVPNRRPVVKTSSSGSSSNVRSLDDEYDRSPFESAIELGCGQFRQNPFKPKGMCSNCLEFHD